MGRVWLECVTIVGPLRSVEVSATGPSTSPLALKLSEGLKSQPQCLPVVSTSQCARAPSIDEASH